MAKENATDYTRDRIIKCAAELFAESGYKGVSMREISSAAGISKASIYYYFSSKEDLYLSLIIRDMEQLVKDLEVIASAQEEPLVLLRRFIKYYVDFSHKRGPIIKLAFRELVGMGERLDELLPDIMTRMQRSLQDILVRGNWGIGQPEMAACAIFGMAHILTLHDEQRTAWNSNEITSFVYNLIIGCGSDPSKQ